MSQQRDDIRCFITEQILLEPERVLTDDEPLLLTGLIDSLGVMRLIYFLEASTGRKIPFTDITIENFNSITAIDEYLARSGQEV